MRGRRSLDEKDLKILEILQENGRASYSEISRSLGMSEAAVYARIQKLIKLGVIKRFRAILDPEKLGYNLTAFIAIIAQPARYESVLKQLEKIPEIQEIYDVTGDYYCLTKVRVRGRDELAKILDEIGSLDGVISTDTKIVLRTIKEDYSIPTSSSWVD